MSRRWAERTPLAVKLPPIITSPGDADDDRLELYCPACDLISGLRRPEHEGASLDFGCIHCGAHVDLRYDAYEGAYRADAGGRAGTRLLRGMSARHYALALCMTVEDLELVLAYHGVTLSVEERREGVYAALRAVETRSRRRPLSEPVERTLPVVGKVRDALAQRWLRVLPPACSARDAPWLE